VLQQERATLEAECSQLAGTLEKVSQKLAAAELASEPLADLEHKFELAMADVRTLRQANAELEQELARRPEPNEGESAELISLREEREALLAEIEELRSHPMVPAADDQALADLQRRFEMAVEDVRELRAEKERLEEQLAKRPQAAVSSGSGGGEQKWEELKRKLLLSLEEESGDLSEDRREERASIEHTIRITDDVVASKDREIHELRHKLETAEEHASTSQANHSMQEAVDSDEVVLEQRARLAAIEEELTDKLRKAELEMSIERAKIAREQTELAEWRIELEALRDSIPKKQAGGSTSSGGKGRWFSKLGLGGDES
jgi:DNA repair exonuclease SbcCD ATPase subunit